MSPSRLTTKILAWQLKHIRHRQFILILSFVIGVLSGLAAILLKNTLYYTNHFLTNGFHFNITSYIYLIYPMAGIVLTVLFVKYFVRDNISHGISKVLYAISKNDSLLRPHNSYSSLIACTLTLGFGGSVGPEAPIVLTGSSIGSNLGRFFRLDYRSTTLLIGCGAAGAIAGIFKAPIAGFVFVIEILMLDLTLTTLIPLIISAVTASLVAYLLMGNEVLFSFTLTSPFVVKDTPFYILLGLFCGGVSFYMIRGSSLVESLLARLPQAPRILAGGVALAGFIFIYPSLFGEGYAILKEVLHGHGEIIGNQLVFGAVKSTPWIFALVILGLVLMKVIAMAVTQGSGGIGGTFAPAIFVGGISGYFTAYTINLVTGLSLSCANFALVGMAGVMAGVMHAPLTAIFLIAEITGGYELLTPLITTAAIAYLTSHYYEPHSIYNRQLAARSELITHDKDKAVLSRMRPDQHIETNFSPVHPDATLGDLVKIVAGSTRNVFPVVDEGGDFHGIILLDNIRRIMFEPELYDKTLVRELMFMPEYTVDRDDTMDRVIQLFQNSDRYNLPVLKNGKYIGFLSRANVFSQYRELLKEFSDD
jgi:CIC family chloride channel protein